MFAVPVTDTLVLALEDELEDLWRLHYIEFDPTAHVSFETPDGGPVLSATVNPRSGAAWIVARGELFAASRELRLAVPLPQPTPSFVPFDVTLIADRYYLVGSAMNVWYYDVPTERWVAVNVPEPRPPLPPRAEGEDAEAYVARTSPAEFAYARAHPDIYCAFAAGADHYFVGALGAIMRLRDGHLETEWLADGGRLVRGHAEGHDLVLAADDPVARIYRGRFDDGFEMIFRHEERALHLTAAFEGRRYIGAGLDPLFGGPFLHTLEDGELVPVQTGCAREPEHLVDLKATGDVLWATDLGGIFRLANGTWTLTELADLA